MKYLKKYEDTNINKPKVGDYVLCEEKYTENVTEIYQYFLNFISNNVGVIKFIRNDDFYVVYNNVPQEVTKFFRDENARRMETYEVKYWSDNKKELEAILASKKYNI